MKNFCEKNIYPSQASVTSGMRQTFLRQTPHCFWFTGFSGAGKSTLANTIEEKLFFNGRLTCILDGDNIRSGLCRDLSFSPEDRTENIRRVAETARLLMNTGIICLAAFVSPMRRDREAVRSIVGQTHFSEIYVRCPLRVCERRDVKGNYKKARSGEILDYTGVSAQYEEPLNPALILDTDCMSIKECVYKAFQFVWKRTEPIG
ncbi:adenylyl-sulfate kinase [Desulfovibrio falkowii]|uniref:adenylyl-sulfate kinase n=1 Tax=Desulfovibrio falkowii TaxID=3136602 RepID=UPI0038B2532A